MNWDAVIARLRKGWVKGMLHSNGRVCLVGAIVDAPRYSARNYHAAQDEYIPALAPHILEHYPERVLGADDDWSICVEFNNHPLTTVDDVIAMCEKARAG